MARLFVPLAAVLLSIGCSDSPGMVGDQIPNSPLDPGVDAAMSDGSSMADGGTPVDASPTTGCGVPATPGFTCYDVQFEGRTRNWCMNVPASYNPSRPYSIAIGLHGCGGQATNVHRHRAPMEAYGDADFLFAYPQSMDTAGACWVAEDLPFIKYVIATISSTYCVNKDRVFVHGMSSGGSMSSNVVAASGAVKAFASTSAGGYPQRPLPAWYYGGTTDSVYSIITSSRDVQRLANGCSTATTPIPNTPCVKYQGCKQALTYCEDSRGHVWPTEDWAEAGVIDFFRAVP